MRNLKQEFITDVVYRSVQELAKLPKFVLDKEVQEIATKAASEQFDKIAIKAQQMLEQISKSPTVVDKNTVSKQLREEVTQMVEDKKEAVKEATEEFLEPSVQFLDQQGKPSASKEDKNDLIKEFVSKTMLEAVRDHKSTSLADLAISQRMNVAPKLSQEKRQSISSSSMSSPKSKRFSLPKWASANVDQANHATAKGKEDNRKSFDSPRFGKK